MKTVIEQIPVNSYPMAGSTETIKKDSENLHPYRQGKKTKVRRTIRKQHYGIQPGDTVVFREKSKSKRLSL